MPNPTAIKFAEDLIKAQIGSLDDLPIELANTIANVFYKMSLQFLEMSELKERNGSIPMSIKNEIGTKSFQELLQDYLISNAQIKTDFEAASDFIKSLREIDKIEKPDIYQYFVEFILDCLKYNIESPAYKTEENRMLERKFKKVDEIPNLIDLMNLI